MKVTFEGTSVSDLVAQAQSFSAAFMKGVPAPTAQEVATPSPTKGKKALKLEEPASEVDDLDEVFGTEESEESEVDDLDLEEPEEMVEETKPRGRPAKVKAPTAEDVMNAAKAHMAKNGKASVQSTLFKAFKVKKVGEVKPEQYAKAIQLLKV